MPLTLPALLFAFAHTALAQSIPTPPDVHGLRAGEHAHAFGAGTTVGNAVVATSDGGWLAVGYTTAGEFGGEDVYVVRTDRAGSVRWTKTIGGAGDDSGWAVARTAPDGFVIVGFTVNFGADGEDVLVISIGDDGKTRWTKTIGGPGNQRAWAMSRAPEGGFYLAAQTDRGPGGALDACVIRIDATGTARWTKTFGGAGTDRLFGIVMAADGGPTAAGLSSASPGAPTDAYIAHLTPAGVVQWERRHGGPADDLAHAVATTADGGYLLTGYGQSQGAGGNDVYLMKCAADGSLLWTRTAGSAGDDRGMMSVPQSRGFVTIGYQRKPDRDWEMWIGTFDDAGRLISERVAGGPLDDRAVMASSAANGDFVVTGALGRDGGASALLLMWLRT